MKSTRRGSDSPVHRREKTPRFQIPLDKWPVSPGTPREASGVPCLNPRRGLTEGLQGVIFKKPVNPSMLKKVLLQQCRSEQTHQRPSPPPTSSSAISPTQKVN